MKIKYRWTLAVMIAAGQFVCLSMAVLWLAHWTEDRARERTCESMLAAIGEVAQSAGNVIEAVDANARPNERACWVDLQNALARCRLPFDGRIIIISASDGSVLCHPDLDTNPSVRNWSPGLALMHGESVTGRVMDVPAYGKTAATGWMTDPDGRVQLLAVRDLPARGAKLLVRQPVAGADQIAREQVFPIRATGVSVAAVLSLFVVLLTMAITQRYENKLAAINGNLERIVEKRSRSLLNTRDAVIFGLAKLAESRDDQTGEHLERIRVYVELLARHLAVASKRLTSDQVRLIAQASSLHDIGKVGVPDSVLLKPGPLTPFERREIEKHTEIGGNCLLALKNRLGEDDFLETACEIAFAHHERWDGDGYPLGLRGDAIPLSARIVAVADVYDALTSDRVYKSAASHTQAAQAIIDGAGTQFDPAVVAAFIARQADFERILHTSGISLTPQTADDVDRGFIAIGI